MSALRHRFGKSSLAGVVLLLTFPLSLIICHAIASTIVGEDRVEDTTLGAMLIFIPLGVGLGLIVADFFGHDAVAFWRQGRRLETAAIVIGALLIVGGVVSLTQTGQGDANIGGGLLIMLGIAALAVGIVRVRSG